VLGDERTDFGGMRARLLGLAGQVSNIFSGTDGRTDGQTLAITLRMH
jgi:hypothetical protein